MKKFANFILVIVLLSACHKPANDDVQPEAERQTKFLEVFPDWPGRHLASVKENGDIYCVGYGTGKDSAYGTISYKDLPCKIKLVSGTPLKYDTDSIKGDVYRVVVYTKAGSQLSGYLSNYQSKFNGIVTGRMFRVLDVGDISTSPGGKYVDSL